MYIGGGGGGGGNTKLPHLDPLNLDLKPTKALE